MAQSHSRKNADFALSVGFAAGVGIHQGVGTLCKPRAGACSTEALDVGAGAFTQQEQFFGKSFGFGETGVFAEFGEPGELVVLGVFNHDAGGMGLVGKLNGGIRHRATSEILGAKVVTNSFGQCSELRVGIAGVPAHHLFVASDSVGVQSAKIFSDQQVLRLEVTVERHLVGLSCGGDLVDTHAANTPGIEEVTGRIENAFTRGDIRLHARMSCCLQKSSFLSLDTILTGK